MIHPTAIIHPKAKLDPSVRVGPYVVIDEGVELGPQCVIGPHVYLTGLTVIGAHNRFHAGCVIGDAPQDLKYDGKPTRLRIGDHNVFREQFSVHRSTTADGETVIGSHNFLMVNAHVAHNCRVGDHVILANGVALGGHAQNLLEGVVGINELAAWDARHPDPERQLFQDREQQRGLLGSQKRHAGILPERSSPAQAVLSGTFSPGRRAVPRASTLGACEHSVVCSSRPS